jgi:hypothetical protein
MRRARQSRRGDPVLFGVAPYGWRIAADKTRIVEDEDEQLVIAVIRHMYFVMAWPMPRIVEELRSMGVVNRRGKPFGLSRVWEIVRAARRTPIEARIRAPDPVAEQMKTYGAQPHADDRTSMSTPRPASVPPPASLVAASKRPPPTENELRGLLVRHHGNIAEVGRELGKERMQVHRWMKKYGISVDEYR